MDTTEIIALWTCIATWSYVTEMLAYLALIFITLDYIGEQVKLQREQLWEQKKERRFQETITVANELKTSEIINGKRYIYQSLPENIEGIPVNQLIVHFQKAEEIFTTFDKIGYLIYQKYISVKPIIENYWFLIWICWKKSESLISWIREQGGQKDLLNKFELLFHYAEAYRIYKGYAEPKIYLVGRVIVNE